MAKPTRNRAQQPQNGVSSNGGSSEGSDGAAPGSANGEPGGGSGSDGGDGDGSVIRPTLNGTGDGDGDGNGGTGNGETRRGRGRPRGSASAKKAEISVTTLSEVISFAHLGLASILADDAWTLDDGESEKLAAAASKVLKHHDTPAFSAYAMDWIGLLMVAGKIYSPRVMHSVAKRASTAKPAPTPGARQEPKQPVAEQGEGFVTVLDPLGSGREMRVPVHN